jgi:hypothetical protein
MISRHYFLGLVCCCLGLVEVSAAKQTAGSIDAGGSTTTSASYSQQSSIGGISGIVSGAAIDGASAKAGYLGQLYNVSGIELASALDNVEETASVQLGAYEALDDGTYLVLPVGAVTWTVDSGPLTAITTSGLATADVVAADTTAVVAGTCGSYDATLSLTILNSIPDNFGSYAGDGLGDDWQVQYFGADNASAAAELDPDGDGQTNSFEFTAGLDPTDPNSVFIVQISENSAGTPQVSFDPVVAGRTYTVKYKDALDAAIWNTLLSSTASDNGTERTITDASESLAAARFYIVEIE